MCFNIYEYIGKILLTCMLCLQEASSHFPFFQDHPQLRELNKLLPAQRSCFLLSVFFSLQMSCPRLFWKSLALEYCSPLRPSVWLVLSLGFHLALMVQLWTGFVSLQERVWSGWHKLGQMIASSITHFWKAESQSPRIPPTARYSSRSLVWTLKILPHTTVLTEHIDTNSVFSCTLFQADSQLSSFLLYYKRVWPQLSSDLCGFLFALRLRAFSSCYSL